MHKGQLYPKLLESFVLWDGQMVYKRQMAERYELRRTIQFFDPHDLVPTINGTRSAYGTYTFGQQQAEWLFTFPNRHGHTMKARLRLGNSRTSILIREGTIETFTDNVLVYLGVLRPILSGWDGAFVFDQDTVPPGLAWGWGPSTASIFNPTPWL